MGPNGSQGVPRGPKGSQGILRDPSNIFFANIDERREMSMKEWDPKGPQGVPRDPKGSHGVPRGLKAFKVLFHYKSSSFRGHQEF